MTKKPGIKVEIFGSEYRIKGDADAEYVKRVAAYVDEKMKQVSQLTADSAVSKIAILAAINIADELLKERQQREFAAKELSEKLRMIEDESR
ncbi:MAG TPA: cell division protein ZapA [Candidatus Edwardsbacteria bacterium]|nr:cell division protein ZapA [Candidatus Edwardsbacteria bacterium]